MLKAIRSFFDRSMAVPEGEDPRARRKDIRLAACALLLELAHADEDFDDDERRHLEGAVRRQYGLDRAQADRLLRLAERERSEAVDLWQFTSLIKERYSLGQKMVLLEVMWGLVYADGTLAPHEQRLMRRISSLLDIEPGYLAETRKRIEPDRGVGERDGREDRDGERDERDGRLEDEGPS